MDELNHPAGRKKDQEFSSDRPGRTFSSQGSARHGMSPEISPHAHEREIFAKEILHLLEKELAAKGFERLILMAPAQFLGELKAHLSERLKTVVQKTRTKNFAEWMSEKEIHEHLISQMKSP